MARNVPWLLPARHQVPLPEGLGADSPMCQRMSLPSTVTSLELCQTNAPWHSRLNVITAGPYKGTVYGLARPSYEVLNGHRTKHAQVQRVATLLNYFWCISKAKISPGFNRPARGKTTAPRPNMGLVGWMRHEELATQLNDHMLQLLFELIMKCMRSD